MPVMSLPSFHYAISNEMGSSLYCNLEIRCCHVAVCLVVGYLFGMLFILCCVVLFCLFVVVLFYSYICCCFCFCFLLFLFVVFFVFCFPGFVICLLRVSVGVVFRYGVFSLCVLVVFVCDNLFAVCWS